MEKMSTKLKKGDNAAPVHQATSKPLYQTKPAMSFSGHHPQVTALTGKHVRSGSGHGMDAGMGGDHDCAPTLGTGKGM